MRLVVRWLLAVVAALLVVALVAYARGEDHHRGDEVGARAEQVAAAHLEAIAGSG